MTSLKDIKTIIFQNEYHMKTRWKMYVSEQMNITYAYNSAPDSLQAEITTHKVIHYLSNKSRTVWGFKAKLPHIPLHNGEIK